MHNRKNQVEKMIAKFFKNIFSFVFMSLFFVLLLIFYLVHVEKMSQIEKVSYKLVSDTSEYKEEIIEETNKYLDNDYSNEIVILNHSKYDIVDYDNFDLYYNKIVNLYNRVKNKNIVYLNEEEKELVKNIYDDKKILVIGDSNTNYFKEADIVKYNKVIPFNGVTVKYQIEKIDGYEDAIKEAEHIILYNGYNIKYYKNTLELANSYQKIIEKILNINPNAKTYVCSIVPATDDKILEDIAQGSLHDFYKGPEFDEKLKKYFNEDYLDLKWINSGMDLHLYDGLHFNKLFYNVMIPYIAYNIKLYDYVKLDVDYIDYKEKNANRFIYNNLINTNNIDYIFNSTNIEYRDKIFKLIEKVKFYDNYNIYNEVKGEIDYLISENGVYYFGDSNIKQFDIFNLIDQNSYGFVVNNILAQSKEIVDMLNEDVKNIFIFNGYNIKYYSNEMEYVEAYKKLCDIIHEYNPDIRIYILSLLPATEQAIIEDLQAPFTHNIVNGVAFDAAIKDAFTGEYAYYIDTKWILKPELYAGDGIHVKKQFYQAMVPYTVYWTKLYE